jgi:2-C-methyl-D-erythritol 2,4-cyclodiphosphate synthase
MNIPRVGIGYDVHRLGPERTLVLGGVEVSTEFGCIAHSDGDVLLHAICDALLGAAGLRDIGHHFPDTDPKYSGISSLELLREVTALLKHAGYAIGNIDSTIILERPKIARHTMQMRENISRILSVGINDVSIKATTSEGLGFVGQGQGISAHAVAVIYSTT